MTAPGRLISSVPSGVAPWYVVRKGDPLPPQRFGRLRRIIPSVFVLMLVGVLFAVARIPAVSATDRKLVAERFQFTELPIALPEGLPQRTIREVNPAYEEIRSWISSVGAAVAVNDVAGTGRAADLCLVDTRSDSVIVTPVPGTGDRYAPFVLDPAPLPSGPGVAPMGCVPGDFNGDGRMDLLTYYWGRTPVVFLHRAGVETFGRQSFHPAELVPQAPAADGTYHGPLWNTNAVAVADFDGDGHPDIGVFNYFPDSPVLDPTAAKNVTMNHSMSRATNAGGAHVLRWTGATAGDRPTISYQEQRGAIPPEAASGWTLGSASADLDGDVLPELYLANDFGHDHLFHNVSEPGRIAFTEVTGRRGAFTPKSMVLGDDSFKGMSAEFGDLVGNGRFDLFISNITTEWGLEESNFAWVNNAATPAEAKAKLERGTAPYDNKASSLGIAWTGWGWDAKMADFDNSGRQSVVQTDGFVKGDINRWAWLQELAASNDLLLANPDMWPKAGPGDDIAGDQTLAFWARQDDGTFLDVSEDLGLAVPIPTRGVAVSDADGNGAQDFAVARQWGAPAYYRNAKSGSDDFLGLRLFRPATGTGSEVASSKVVGTPAYGAQVRLTTADGKTQIAQLDGGSGHSGKRSFEVFFGLGPSAGKSVTAELTWRDLDGAVHRQALSLAPGWHDLMLTTEAAEVSRR
ncbi:CRTAC1 family protein [Salinispora arenicola]|uniref:CRTAC1 family protein n=1 Tax=Salinispora arenicola TaxID=168697 RepID=UPI0000EB9431|nr:CRTAC1 family protein [Salinispora arenicola]MCN0177284.1 CRTAC1 family protein [Salinispora arenicola]NIL55898.1 CRTAC1 family protein [Salinispora arenicola]NIL60584.1 CRTAC1 family protein [Salinispora arenicola]